MLLFKICKYVNVIIEIHFTSVRFIFVLFQSFVNQNVRLIRDIPAMIADIYF